MKPAHPKSLSNYIIPLDTHGEPMIGSTDVADVSWVIPTVQAHVPTMAIGTPGHSWQLTAQGKMPDAHKGLAHVAKIMAATGIDVLTDKMLLAQVKKVHFEQTRATSYRCPIPAEVKPPVQPRPETLLLIATGEHHDIDPNCRPIGRGGRLQRNGRGRHTA
ncbi:MAG: hypothetical protein ACMX3H_15550 [Sodalis sp. (in: enterobacteria)]|uniref:hypothetical protein n=1 Tax=Sodalis sp. (in: enterobacteria) TaxID=1898979 RepID=UPI0039E5DECD